MSTLYEKITLKSAEVGVIGLGYVGLPLAVEKAKAGFRVLGFDVQREKVDKINSGENYIGDVVPEDLATLTNNGHLSATDDFSRISECDVLAICVPTPLDKFKQPDLSYVVNTANTIEPFMHKDMLVVLESTTYPGTTEEVLLPILSASGLKVGRDFYLAYSPERVDPGNLIYKTKNTPKVVGGCTPECLKHAKALYEAVLQAPVFAVSSPKEAEMAKILENTFRIVNCALANEMAVVCRKLGINIWEVIEAASTKPFGFMPFYPGPGVGGHCIPIDPFYLTYKARSVDYHTRLIELAGEINDYMPEYVVTRLQDLLNDERKPLRGSKIVLLGIAYKGDIDDVRESPALKVWDHLEAKGADVVYFDPYCRSVKGKGKIYESCTLSECLLKNSDAVAVTTAHTKGVDYSLVLEASPLILDTKNVISKVTGVDVKNCSKLHLL
ncbi:nucleotide sugar dehydrogenase [Acetomicrobium sp.]|uniref:nucleotide sugar dehydrogenase n=1 Tax=Acetomicrobium sp. TaxID=1872099 RepID=UPI002B26170F|nr:nucleotide sugar dehydrogenase [Acetomicrobium sp.]